MNIKSFFKSWKEKTPKAWSSERPISKTTFSYDLLAKEGYEKNVIVYRCINLIAKNLSLPPWTFYKEDHELDQHYLLDLIDTPNTVQTRPAFLEELVSDLLIDGNAYIEAVEEDGHLSELKILRPDSVQLLKRDGAIVGLEVREKGKKRQINAREGFQPFLHLKLFNALNRDYGMSPIQVAASAIDQHNAVGIHNLSLLKNGGRPCGALSMPEGTRGIDTKKRQELKQNLEDFYQGEYNAGKVLVLEGGMSWKDIGLSPKDLDYISGKNLSTREIAQAFGVPTMLVGVPGDSTFSNYKEARFHLWEDTVLPLLHMIVEKFNHWLPPLYGTGLRFSYDADQIPALICRRERLWQQVESATFLTINEKRSALGYSPVKEGDRFN